MHMKINQKIGILNSLIKVKFLCKRIPVVISWHLLNRCNRRCKYCYRWNEASAELATKAVTAVIDELKKMGTRVIIFSGGEPLLREDIAEIISYSQKSGIFTGLTSNGKLLPQRIDEIKTLDMLKLSFDGPREIHDFLRGDGSYEEVMQAIVAAKEKGMNIKLNTTLTKYNIDYIDFILSKAREFAVKVKFQPVSHVHAAGYDICSFFPDESKYRKTLTYLIGEKKKNNPYVINSIASLRYFQDWPELEKLNCYAGKLICCILPNGDVSGCSATRDSRHIQNCLSPSFRTAFKKLKPVVACKGCWCTSTLELNCFLRFNPDTLLNIKNVFS